MPRETSPADMKGQVWLLNVWAPWCVSCRVEHKLLMALAQSGTAPPIVGLNWKDKTREAEELLARTGNPYVAVPDDLSGRVGIDWGVTGTPETYVIDQTGIVRLKHVGPIDLDVWQTKFVPKLKDWAHEDFRLKLGLLSVLLAVSLPLLANEPANCLPHRPVHRTTAV